MMPRTRLKEGVSAAYGRRKILPWLTRELSRKRPGLRVQFGGFGGKTASRMRVHFVGRCLTFGKGVGVRRRAT